MASDERWDGLEVDELLVDLGAAYDRLAAGMRTLRRHPGQAFLRTTRLSGETQVCWTILRPRVEMLRAHFDAIGDVLVRVRAIRNSAPQPGPAERAELARLLREPAIGLDADGMPAADPVGPPASWFRLDQLVPMAQRSCGELTARLSDVDDAVATVRHRISASKRHLEQATRTAVEVGDRPLTGELDRLGAELKRAFEALLADPLGAARSGTPASDRWTELDRLTADLRARLTELDRLRRGYDDRLMALRAAVDGVALAEAEAVGVYRTAARKIASSGLPSVPAAADGLRDRLARLTRRYQDRVWNLLPDEFTALERDTAQARQDARQVGTIVDGLLARRVELRGRLGGYRAKATRLGLADRADVIERYQEAQALLDAGPCDLPAATVAVYRYQHLIASLGGAPARGARPPYVLGQGPEQ